MWCEPVAVLANQPHHTCTCCKLHAKSGALSSNAKDGMKLGECIISCYFSCEEHVPDRSNENAIEQADVIIDK